MSLGFNSDVPAGGDVLHVQTENYGEPQWTIVTLVYYRGRILHRRNSSYKSLLAAPGFSEEFVSSRVKDQHRSVIEEIRKGAISVPRDPATPSSPAAQGIQLRLRNADSWFAAGQATLDVEVLQRKDNSPVESVRVDAFLTGSADEAHCEARTGPDGLARMRFTVPNTAAGGAELVIRADAGGSQATDEIRFILRSKSSASARPVKNDPKRES